jgi:hypothetical protein
MKRFYLLIMTAVLLTSCEALTTILGNLAGEAATKQTASINDAAGLKEALTVGVKNSVSRLNKENGFFSDNALKILLPDEAQTLVKNINLIPGGQKLVDQAVLRLNRAAEDAAVEATPIITSAIVSMTFSDAKAILFSTDNAATEYLRTKTYSQLVNAFKPKIEASLNKNLVGGISATTSWTELTTAYNKMANTTVGQLSGLKRIDTDISAYVTRKALDGLFVQIAQEEKSIRQDPAARVTTLLKQVFGQLD